MAQRGRAFALIVAAAFAGACGDDSGDDGKEPVDSGKADAGRQDASTDAGGGMDAGRDSGTDAGRDAGGVDAGQPAVAGEDAPTLTKVGFYNDDLGPRILFSGSDKNGDIATYTYTFFDMANEAVSVNCDGDDATQETVCTGDVPHDPGYQEFVVKLTPSAEVLMGSSIKSIKVMVKDSGGRPSAELSANLGPAPQVGGACDPLGFNRCASNNVCAPGNTGNYSCVSANTARQQACANNGILTLAAPGSVSGRLNNASFWDAPAGCVAGGMPTGLADRIVKVTLATAAPTLTLSTSEDTAFRGVIYELPTATPLCSMNAPGCGDNECVSCADGAALVLKNAAAGDHYFVVERNPTERNGDTFTLTATVGN